MSTGRRTQHILCHVPFVKDKPCQRWLSFSLYSGVVVYPLPAINEEEKNLWTPPALPRILSGVDQTPNQRHGRSSSTTSSRAYYLHRMKNQPGHGVCLISTEAEKKYIQHVLHYTGVPCSFIKDEPCQRWMTECLFFTLNRSFYPPTSNLVPIISSVNTSSGSSFARYQGTREVPKKLYMQTRVREFWTTHPPSTASPFLHNLERSQATASKHRSPHSVRVRVVGFGSGCRRQPARQKNNKIRRMYLVPR